MARTVGARVVPLGLVLGLLALLAVPRAAPAQEVRYYYDALNRLIGVMDFQGHVAEYVYDPVGNLLQVRRYAVDPGALVSIAMMTPTKGPEAATVELLGQGFATNPADNTVRFNGVLATVTDATTTRLQTTVPVGATTGPVTVATLLGSATAPDPFTVLTGVTVSPAAATLFLRRTQQFTATAPVFWTVNGIQGGNGTVGTITADGLYTPPPVLPTPSTVTIAALHQEDPALTGTATVTLDVLGPALANPVSVARNPAPATVTPLVAPAVSLARSPGQANPWTAPPVAITRSPTPAQATPWPAAAVSLTRSPLPAQATPLVARPVALARAPVVLGISPATGSVGAAVSVTVTGAGFTGATALTFEKNGTLDATLTPSNLVVSPDGMSATATVTIAGGATVGPRVVRIAVPGATATAAGVGSNVFTVTNP